MKCKYCNADIEQEAQFCPNCGKDLSKFNKCVKCGELLDNVTVFCPHCGTEQPREEKVEVERNCSKKWLLLLPLIALVVGAGTWYFFSDGFSFGDSTQTTTAETVNSDPIKTDNSAVEEAKTRLKDILSAIITNDVYGENLSQNMNKYFTEGYKTFYNRACEKADKEGCEQPKIWWQYSDDDPSSFVINSVESLSEDEVKSILTLSGELNVGTYEVILKREKDDWLIDKVIEKETHMKDYEVDNSSVESTISSAEEDHSLDGKITMIGKVSKYGIHMVLAINGANVIGYYYYDSQGDGNRVTLKGTLTGENLKLNKYDKESNETGYFEGAFDGTSYQGENMNYNRDEALPFSVEIAN